MKVDATARRLAERIAGTRKDVLEALGCLIAVEVYLDTAKEYIPAAQRLLERAQDNLKPEALAKELCEVEEQAKERIALAFLPTRGEA